MSGRGSLRCRLRLVSAPHLRSRLQRGDEVDLKEFQDLTKRHDEGIVVVITHPETGAATDIRITVTGPWSERTREAGKQIAAENLNGIDNELFQQKLLARRVLSWEGIEWDGKPLEFSLEEAEKLFTDRRYYWLYSQVLTRLDGVRLFRGASDRAPAGGRHPRGRARLSDAGRNNAAPAPRRHRAEHGRDAGGADPA